VNPTQRQFDYMDRWRADSMRPLRGREISIDLFCGGGGASLGIEAAIGAPVDEAINHSLKAIYYHEQNHPATNHHSTDVFDVHPLAVSKGRPVGLLWLSPDCTHFSKSRGKKPKKKNIRSLATVGLWYARHVRPRVIMLENVAEFVTWCRLDRRTMQPDFRKRGECFYKFVRRLEQMGYVVEHRTLKACDYGAPTTRERLVLIARCDGEPIVWPKTTHGTGRNKTPYRTAAECIDFSLPTVSIFATKKECKAAGINAVRPLAENTMRRIARGVVKFVINHPDPFIVPEGAAPFITEYANASNQRNMLANEPLRTICAQVKGGHFALIAPFVERMHGMSSGESVEKPLSSLCAQVNHHAVVSAFLAKHYTGVTGSDLRRPLGTVTGVDHHSLVACHGDGGEFLGCAGEYAELCRKEESAVAS
jgi:DNA (cytosine-5)-methyltransferase 1